MKRLSKLAEARQVVFVLLLSQIAAHAGERTSTNYFIPADTADAGGKRTTSASYTNDGSLGGIAGVSTFAASAGTVKSGYIGQLYEVTALQLAASPDTIAETGTRQLSATQVLDDDSTLAVSATSVTWSVADGPLTSINANGLATAGTVYEDTIATAQGVYAGDTDTLEFNVLDTIADNFGTYASDGIGDDWQVLYFGPNNDDAGPTQDPDGDGDNNLYEYHARLLPNDPTSFLSITLTPDAAEGEAGLTLSPGKAGVSYAVSYKNSLLDADWIPLTTIAGSDAPLDFTDLAASGARKFYIVTPTRTP